MTKQARSARGHLVDFDLLAIKQQLDSQPIPIGVNQRRKFIDEKDGIKHRRQENYIVSPPQVDKPDQKIPDALCIAAQAAKESDSTAKK